MAWKKLELALPNIDISPLTEIIEKIKEFINAIVTILETILTIISTIADPLVAAIKALIDKIKDAVESFLEDLGGYALYVPIRKRLMTNFLGLGDVTPSWAGQLGIFGAPSSTLDPSTPELNEFLVNANRYNGGNYGFFKTVMESLYDEGDIHRPQFFEEEDYIGGVVMLMGTDFDPLGFLDDIWKFFGLFGFPDSVPKVPRPKGLKATAMSDLSGGTFTVLLTWDVAGVPVTHLEDLGGVVLWPSRYAVLRVKNDVRALSASSVIDLMGTRSLSVGAKFNNGDAEVIAEDKYDMSKMSYIDEDVSAKNGDSFYYAVAWKLKAFNADETFVEGNGTDLDYWYISNVARVVPFPTLPASTPPDWVRTPSVASLFPEFARFLRRIVLELENFASKLYGAADLLKQYVDFLKAEVLRYEAIVNKILDELAKLIAKFDLPTAGIYYRTFKGTGGNTFLLNDLAASFMSSYPGAPPFGKGDEFVTGAVLLAGGNELLVDGFLAAISWIFGTPEEAAMSAMLADLGTVVTEVETTYFGPDMQPTATPPAAITFDVSMCPVHQCSPPAPPVTTFGPNFQVISNDTR